MGSSKYNSSDRWRKGALGRLAYTKTINENLFEPLEPSSIENFKEMVVRYKVLPRSPAKMQAVHSSSALGLNIFQYWEKIAKVPMIAIACNFDPRSCEEAFQIVFEEKYPVGPGFGIPPNIDVVIHCSEQSRFGRLAIESKFSEAYAAHHIGGFKNKYLLDPDLWKDVPHACTIC